MGLPGVHTAGPSRCRYILQSSAAAAARHQVDGGPIAFGIRLHLRDNQSGAPLTDIEICSGTGTWRVGTGRAGGATLQAMGTPSGDIRGVRVQSMGRTGPNDPSAKITGLQFILADGGLLPESGSLVPMETAHGFDTPPENWTRECWLPADTRFAGLLLSTGWPQESVSDDTGGALLQGPPCIIDLQVLHTSWLTCNSHYNLDSDLNWAAPDAAAALGPPGLLLRAQTSGDRRYGLVDIGVGRADGVPGVAIGNQDFTQEGYIATDGRPITGIMALEVDHQGIVDLAVCFEDGSFTPWAFHATGLPPGAKIWSHTVPEGHWAVGLRLRTQHHFGVVDVCLRVNTPTATALGSFVATPPSPAVPAPWEWVQEPTVG